jgi:hypothetical protein
MTYESWLSTALYDGAAGAVPWQLLEGAWSDAEGFGFRISDPVCATLRNFAVRFSEKSLTGALVPPEAFLLLRNYPNPFNTRTTLTYTLPFEGWVRIIISDVRGARVRTLVDDIQRPGERKELFDGQGLASGWYAYTLLAIPTSGQGRTLTGQGKMLYIR